MKKTYLILPICAFCCAVTFAFYNSSIIEAQTNTNANRARQIASPTPQPSPTIAPKPAPTVAPTPDDEGVIRIDTELVNLNVRVVDRNNRSIANLRKEDFKVFEDNVPQPIDFFSTSEVPTNYTMVIDNSGSLRQQLDQIIEAGKIIVNTNRPDDEASIIRFVSRDKISIEQEFTASKKDLIDTLENNLFIEGGQTAIRDAVYLAAETVNDYEKTRDPNDRKRRALILVSDGEDRDSYYSEAQLFELLKETDVQIYVIGFVNDLSNDGGFISKSPQGKSKAFLERLAAQTGGKVYFPNALSELNGIAADIAKELRTQYSIGYIPTNDRKDGSSRSIKVVVNDGPNKQKRIALTRSEIKTDADSGKKPNLQTQKKSQ